MKHNLIDGLKPTSTYAVAEAETVNQWQNTGSFLKKEKQALPYCLSIF